MVHGKLQSDAWNREEALVACPVLRLSTQNLQVLASGYQRFQIPKIP